MAAVIEDDKEISDLFASGDESVQSKLPGIVQRFREDHNSKLSVFETLVAAASPIVQPTSYATATSTPPPSTNISLPSSLQSLQEYVPLLQALLGISEPEAIRILAVKNETEDAGSVPFLLDCVDICFHQRAARIATIADLITKSSQVGDILDVIDQSTTTSKGSPRGLFRMIISTVCQPDPRAPPMMRRPTTVETDDHWKAFLQYTHERQMAGRRLERSEALNALLVLLYDYMEVEPSDLGVLLVSFVNLPSDKQQQGVVSLILLESIALWRTLGDGDENMVPLKDSHPLLRDSDDETLRALADVMRNSRRPGWELATFAYGLLLHSTEDSLREEGFLLAKWANSELDAFTILYDVMSTMVIPIDPTPVLSLEPLHSDENDTISDVNLQAEELNSSVLAATVGRELLSATLIAFRGVLLPESKLPPIDDLNRLASTTAAIFQNSPTLCSKFWDSWNASPDHPLGRLLRASLRLATQATEAAKTGFRDRDEILRAMAPLLQLLAAILYDSVNMQEALPLFLPPDMIRYAIDLMKLPSTSEPMRSTRGKIFSSLATLSRVGSSDEECCAQLRSAFEHSFGSAGPDGPLSLACTISPSDYGCVSDVFSILSNLVRGASKGWLVNSFEAIKYIQDHPHIWRSAFKSSTNALPLVKLNTSLIRRLHEVAFEASFSDALVESVLYTLNGSVKFFAERLLFCGHDKSEHALAASIMDGMSLALAQSYPITRFHRSGKVRTKATTLLNELLGLLAFKIGTHVSRYAVFPVLSYALEKLDSLDHSNTAAVTLSMFESHREGAQVSDGTELLKPILDEFSVDSTTRSTQARFDEFKNGMLQPALSGIRLLNAWVGTLDVGDELDIDRVATIEDSFTAILSLMQASLPVPLALANRLNPIYLDSYKVPVAALLVAYAKPTSSDVSLAMASETISFLSTTISKVSGSVGGSPQADDIINALNHCGGFISAIDDAIQAGFSQSGPPSDDKHEFEKQKVVSLQMLEVLSIFSGYIPVRCTSLLGINRLKRLIQCINTLADMNLSNQQSSKDILNLRLVGECARCIEKIWKQERSSYRSTGSLLGLLDEDKTLLTNILLLVLERGNTNDDSHTEDGNILMAKLSLVEIAFDMLSAELHWSSSRSDSVSNLKCLQPALAAVLELSRFVDSTRYYNQKQDFLSCCESFSFISRGHDPNASIAVPGDMSIAEFMSFTSTHTWNNFLLGTSIDPFYERLFVQNANTSLALIASKYNVIDAQQRSLQSWSRFLHSFTSFLKAEKSFKPAWNEKDLFPKMFSLIIEAVGRDGRYKPLDFPELMSSEYLLRIDAVVGQLLILVEQEIDIDYSHLTDGLSALADTLDSLMIFRLDNKICCTIRRIFACGSFILRKTSSLGVDGEKRELWQALLAIAKTTSTVLQYTSRKAGGNCVSGVTNESKLLDQAVALLSQVVLLMSQAQDSNILAQQVCLIFNDTNLFQTASSRAVELKSSRSKASLLCLWTALIESSEMDALELLADNKAYLSMVSGDDHFSRGDRGLLLSSMKFTACCLRISSKVPRHREAFRSMATSFIARHKGSLLDVLFEISTDNFVRDHPKRNLLDFQRLGEAKHIFYLLSLYCEDKQGPRRSTLLDGSLLQSLKEQASKLVAMLSTYLGAASSARALFWLLYKDIEAENVDECDPAKRILQRGNLHAKRTARDLCSEFIRDKTTNFKLAFTVSAATMMDSWRQILNGKEGTEDDWNDEEKKCIMAVANECGFAAECEVADCLFHILGFLWAVHPARDSFVMYTAYEVEKMNTSRVIKLGSTVAFRDPDSGTVFRGDVKECDNLNLEWKVEAVVRNRKETYQIKKAQLLGIQDKGALIPTLQFGATPDTSVDFYHHLASPSLGHLLLTARWCRQYAEELQLNGNSTNNHETVLQNLAEITSIVIAEEASLFYERQQMLSKSFQIAQIDIIDLYGETEDFEKLGLPSRDAQASTLKSAFMGSTKIWEMTRERLYPYFLGNERVER